MEADEILVTSTNSVRVTFSQRSDEIELVREIVDELVRNGVKREVCFFQDNIHDAVDTGWQSQWLRAADASVVVVCVVSESYTQSTACVSEWNAVAHQREKRIVVCADNPRELELEARSGRLTTDQVGARALRVTPPARHRRVFGDVSAGRRRGVHEVKCH